MFVVLLRADFPPKHPPTPQVHQIAERQESNLVQTGFEELIDGGLVILSDVVEEADLVEVFCGLDREGDGVTDGFVET